MHPVENVFHGHPDTTLTGHPGTSDDANVYIGPAPDFRTTLRFKLTPQDVEILANGGNLMVTVITYGVPLPPMMAWSLRGMQNEGDSFLDEKGAAVIDEIAHTDFAGGKIGD